MKKISEKNLSNIIKRNFNSNTILVNFKGIILACNLKENIANLSLKGRKG